MIRECNSVRNVLEVVNDGDHTNTVPLLSLTYNICVVVYNLFKSTL